MVSLQQCEIKPIDGTQLFKTNENFVAIHRRSWTSVSYCSINKAFSFIHHDDSKNCWNITNMWRVSDQFEKIICVSVVEAYNCFVFVATGCNKSWLLLKDLNGKSILEYEVGGITDIVCADVDQQNREIFIGCKTGRLLCFYMHAKPLGSKKHSKPFDIETIINITLRRQVRLTGGSTHHKSPSQIASVDLLGFCLILSTDGSVASYTSNRFDLLFLLKADQFALKPCRLWVDKFGPDFVIQCKSADSTNEQLEYWTMPTDYSSCEIGQFGRLKIPLTSSVIGVSIESVGVSGAASFITTVTSDLNVQLWRPTGDGSLLCESKLGLTLPAHIHSLWTPTFISDIIKDEMFVGIRNQHSIMTYMKASEKLPGSQVLFIATIGNAVCKIGIHLPSRKDLDYGELCADIAIAQLQLEQRNDFNDNDLNFTEIFAPRQTEQPAKRPMAAMSIDSVTKSLEPIVEQFSSITLAERFDRRKQEEMMYSSGLYDDSYLSQSIALGSDDGGGISIMSDSKQVFVPLGPLSTNAVNNPSSEVNEKASAKQDQPIMMTDTVNTLTESEVALINPLHRYDLEIDMGDKKVEKDGKEAVTKKQSFHSTESPPQQSPSQIFSQKKHTDQSAATMSPKVLSSKSRFSPVAQQSPKDSPLVNQRKSPAPDLSPLPIVSPNPSQQLSKHPSVHSMASVSSSPSQHELVKQMLSAADNGSVASYDMHSPSLSVHVDDLALASRKLAGTLKNSYTASVQPHAVYCAPQQFLFQRDITRTSNTQGKPGDLFQLISPFGVVIQPLAQNPSMQVVSRQGLKDGYHMRIGHSKFNELSFNLSSFACRTGLFSVVTDLKEVFVFNLKAHMEAMQPPVNVGFEIRQQTAVSVISCVDVLLQHPAKPLVNSRMKVKSQLKKSDQVPIKTEPDIVGVYSLVMVGDSDGKVHYAVVDSGSVCSVGALRAHTSSIVSIVTTGDSVRPMWKIGSERSLDCDHIVPVAVPGSGLVTLSRDGEVKTWQPVFTARSTKGKSGIEKVFLTYTIEWRLAGIFVVNEVIPQSGLPSQRLKPSQLTISSTSSQQGDRSISSANLDTSKHPDGLRKIRGVESVCIDPTCMHLIISFRNGFLEQWPIPGLIDMNNGALSTTQSASWVNCCHFDAVHNLVIYVHSSNTSIAEVDVSRENEARDDVISQLAAYIKGSQKKTVGYTYQQLKALTANSSMVTSSRDLSVILWSFGFSRTFSVENSSTFLVPHPCRRFSFSDVPTHGVCYCTSLNVNNTYLQSSVWKLSAIVAGIVVHACSDLRSALFKQDDAIGSEHRYEALEQLTFLDDAIFEDDLFLEDAQGRFNHKRCIPSIPAICPVAKPAVVVSAIAGKAADTKGQDTTCWSILDKWALVSTDRLSLCLHYDDLATSLQLGHTEPPRPLSPTLGPSSPTLVAARFTQFNFDLGERDLDNNVVADEVDMNTAMDDINAEGRHRVVFNGIHMVVDSENEDPREEMKFREKVNTPAKYSVVKLNEHTPARPSMLWSPDGMNVAAGMVDSDYVDRGQDTHDEILMRFAPPIERPLSTSLKRTDFQFTPEHSFMPAVVVVDTSQTSSEALPQLSTNIPALQTVRALSPKVNPQQFRVENPQQSVERPHSRSFEYHETSAERVRVNASPHNAERNRKLSITNVTFSRDSQTFKMSESEGVEIARASSASFSEDSEMFPAHVIKSTKSAEQPERSRVTMNDTLSSPEKSLTVDASGVLLDSMVDFKPSTESFHTEEGLKSTVMVPQVMTQRSDQEVKRVRRRGEEDSSVAEVSIYSSLTEATSGQDGNRLTRSAKLLKNCQTAKKTNLDLLVKESKEAVYTSNVIPVRPEQGVRQQLGKNSTFATIGKIQNTSQKVVIKKEVTMKPPPPSAIQRQMSKKTLQENDDDGVELDFDELSVGSEEKKTRGPSRKRTTPAAVLPGAVEKVRINQFTLDVVDNKMIAKRKNAVLKVVQNLQSMGAVGDAVKPGDLDEESVVSSYFDRAAPPIHGVKKPSRPKKRLVSKRFDPPPAPGEKTAKSTGPVTSANLAGLADGFTKAERELFDSLDEDAKAAILAELKKNKGTKGGKGKNKDLFKDLTAKKLAEAAALAQLNMDIELEVIEVTDRALKVKMVTETGGSAILVLAYFAETNKVPLEALTDRNAVREIDGYVQFECRTVLANSTTEVVFTGLRPLRAYVVYGIIDRSEADPGTLATLADDELGEASTAEGTTLTEMLDIEWGRLSEDMRRAEIKAAIRSKLIQSMVKTQKPVIILPKDDEIDVSPATMEQFYNSSHKASPWMDFLKWWAGDDLILSTRPRAEFLLNECLLAAKDSTITAKYLEQKFCKAKDIDAIVKFANETIATLAAGKIKFDKVTDVREFRKFRSWYKGGQVVVEIEEADAKKRLRRLSLALKAVSGAPTMDDELVDLVSQQLRDRTNFLLSRIEQVDACKLQISRLVDGYRFSLIKSLTDSDLIFKRASLSATDIMSIMCTTKLTTLCVARKLVTADVGLSKVDPAVLGKESPFTACEIAAVDIFMICLPESLKPDDPPPVDMACLPGTNRKPLKAWQLCSAEEKTLELTLACTLDSILEIAIQDGMAVPEPEDATLVPGQFPIRDRRWQEFTEWYAGEEYTNPIPGKGIPTLQRVIFAETTETRNVEEDESVVNSMLEHKLPLPKEILINAGMYEPPEITEEEADLAAAMAVGDDEAAVGFKDFQDTLLNCYERAAATVTGQFVRFDLLRRNIAMILTCRRLSVMRLMWPPGPARLGTQFMFPRMGLLTPKYELPPKRIKLCPSRYPHSLSVRQIMGLYPVAVLENDDRLMQKAEADGIKLRAYYEWLTHETERVEESRELMLGEDARAREMRDTHILVESQIAQQANKLNTRASALDRDEVADPDAIVEEFAFMHSVPKEYWYIFEESCEFIHGSGVHNGDEVEELRQLEIKRANKAVQDAIAFENYLQEEKNRREMAELERQRKEETDRRLAEGVVRRRHLREFFEEQKRLRIKNEEDEVKRLEQQRLDLLALKEQELEALRIQTALEREAQRIVDENIQMAIEESLTIDLRLRMSEMRRMEHEDILAFIREQHDQRERDMVEKRYAELQELYVPFEPFQFKRSRVKKPILHAILNTSVSEDYPVILHDSHHHHHHHRDGQDDEHSHNSHSTSSHHSHVENTLTSSAYNKRSERYKALYEGKGGFEDKSNVVAAAASLSTVVENSNESVPFSWHRESRANPTRRISKSSPTKKDMRNGNAVSSMLKNYGSEWTLQRDVSPACFVLTSKEPLRPISGGTNVRRSLAALAPILEPLRDTSIFNQNIAIGANQMSSSSVSQTVNSFPFLRSPIAQQDSLHQSKSMSMSFKSPSLAPPSHIESHLENDNPPFTADERVSISPFSGGVVLPATSLEFNDSLSCDHDAESAFKINTDYARSSSASEAKHSSHNPTQSHSAVKDMSIHQVEDDSVVDQQPSHLSEYSNAFSLFRSMSQNIMVDMGGINANNLSWDPGHEHKSRNKLKELLASSADAIATANEAKLLEFQKNQKKLVFSSLTAIDSNAQHQARMKVKRGAGTTKSTVEPNVLRETKRKQAEVNRLKQELKELGIVDESLLDFRTRQLAKSASESVMRNRLQRDILKQYVSSGAVENDSYYLMACEPGVRDKTSLETSSEVQRYVQEIASHVSVEDGEDISYLTNRNVLPPKKKSLAKLSVTSKSNLNSSGLNAFSSLSGGLSSELFSKPVIGGIMGNPVQLQQFQPKGSVAKVPLTSNSSTPSLLSKPAKVIAKQRSSVDLFIKTPTSSRMMDMDMDVDGGASMDSSETATLIPMVTPEIAN